MAERLNQVLGLIDQLQAVDTQGIEPMSHALDAQPCSSACGPTRSPKPTGARTTSAVAPAVEQGLYLVPKVIE